jgi:hypothetical protein
MKLLGLAKQTFCIAALLGVTGWSASANNIVVDPGFEASADGLGPHPFSPAWTDVDPSGNSGVGGDSAFAHSGNNYAFLGATPNMGSLSQNLATMTGTSYTLSFWLANDMTAGLPPTNSFEVFWNGIQIFTLTNAAVFDYTQFTFGNLVATGPSTALEFRYAHDNDFFRLDDVFVGVPESGSSVWLTLPVFALLGVLHFKIRAAKPLPGV